jgi:hypothetical protein
MNCLFAESWIDGAAALDDMDEYEVLFEDEDMIASFLSCALSEDCFNVNEEALAIQMDASVLKSTSQWDVKVYNGI